MEVIEAHLICVQRIRYDLFPLCDTYLFCLPQPLIYDWYRMYKLTDWRTADRWRVDVPDTLRNCEPVQTARIYNGSGRTHNRRLVVKSFRSTTFNFSPVPSHKLKTECRQADPLTATDPQHPTTTWLTSASQIYYQIWNLFRTCHPLVFFFCFRSSLLDALLRSPSYEIWTLESSEED